MAHPCTIQKSKFFYPIGHRAAVCLTESLSLEQSANILLLNCGDPRDILFTLHMDGGRPIDFTCCETEPAVLARNILLFACFTDGKKKVNSEKIFQIFYHFYIDQESLDRLHAQCRKLVEVAVDIDSWNTSKFGKFMRMCTKDTLAQLKQHWQLYLDYKVSKKDRVKMFQTIIEGTLRFAPHSSSYIRSSGPCWAEAETPATEIITHFWKDGVASQDANVIAKATRVNPTFVFTDGIDDFCVHYATDPLAGFHHVMGCSSIKGSNRRETTAEHLVAAAKKQFHDWGVSFRSAVIAGSVKIRFHIGGVLEFCHGLHHWQLTGSIDCRAYSAQWKSNLLILDGGEYDTQGGSHHGPPFDIIETSNLLDQLGLLNIITATAPLLRRLPSSTIYTDMLVASTQEPTKAFTSRLCGDIGTFGVLFGLVPQTYVSEFSSSFSLHELLFVEREHRKSRFYERLGWRFAALGEPRAVMDANSSSLILGPKQFARFIYKLYLKMFEFEDLRTLPEATDERERRIIHYNRESFAKLLRLLKAGTPDTDWKTTMESFDDLVQSDKVLITGMEHYQDLCHHLHLAQVFTLPILYSKPTVACRNVLPPSAGNEGLIFHGWKWEEIPKSIYVVVVVPRYLLKDLANISKWETPIIQAEIFTRVGYNIFSSVHAVFAKISIMGKAANARITLTDDPEGWAGTSPLVAILRVPTWKLLINPEDIVIRLKSVPNCGEMAGFLGYGSVIFSVKLFSPMHVMLCRNLPNSKGPVGLVEVPSVSPPMPRGPITPVKVLMDIGATFVLSLTIRVDIEEENAKRSLLRGMVVTARQTFPHIMEVTSSNGSFVKEVVFPFPVDGRSLRTHTDRRNAYIEIVVTPFKPLREGADFSMYQLPVITNGDSPNPTLWNIHSLRGLNKLPILNTIGRLSWEWYVPHFSLQFSDREWLIRERCRRGKWVSETKGPLIDVKDSLFSLFTGRVGAQGNRPGTKVFGFVNVEHGAMFPGFDFVIFVADIRMDLASHTAVTDACVLFLTSEVPEKLRRDLLVLGTYKSSAFSTLMTVEISPEEKRLWSRLLPAYVERCREWKHDPATCKYRRGKARFQLAPEPFPESLPGGNSWKTLLDLASESFICDCGLGKDLPETFTNNREFRPFAPWVTRVALSPLFGVSYMEPVGVVHGGKDMDEIIELCNLICWNPDCHKGELDGVKQFKCPKCGVATYCSAACQRKHYKVHKKLCENNKRYPY
ncbi:hypothetical protein BZA05DRAFT_376326 [Tricharina praecox]|uniref:uncharacterized protein n=1 Tax=Tricharina praecox TaxID=43433 RepID=UPI00221EE545|nr:uncharacterized protein BZA05DRAFT_376326 [Tricharina praecox]KAI5848090.1 hypothetical protein BZA05DRAFT_376326 [Tricharina praecox]